MDSLPSLIVTKILCLLPGCEAYRFNRLNSTFRQIIEINQTYFKRHLIAAQFSDFFELAKCNDFDRDHFIYNGLSDAMIRKQPVKTYHSFFALLVQRNPNHSIRDQFDYMLEKADIAEMFVVGFRNAEWIRPLAEAVKASQHRIYSIFACPSNEYLIPIRGLLAAIANQKEKDIVKPLLRMDSVWLDNIDLRPMNEVSSMFSEARLEMDIAEARELIEAIVKKWNADPFRRFHFHLYVKLRPYLYMTGEFYRYRWNITKTNFDEFFRISPEDKSSSVLFTDPQTDYALLFDKRNGTPNSNTILVFIETVLPYDWEQK